MGALPAGGTVAVFCCAAAAAASRRSFALGEGEPCLLGEREASDVVPSSEEVVTSLLARGVRFVTPSPVAVLLSGAPLAECAAMVFNTTRHGPQVDA